MHINQLCMFPWGPLKASCSSFLVFQPNEYCDIHKELGETHILSIEVIFLREIVNISVR